MAQLVFSAEGPSVGVPHVSDQRWAGVQQWPLIGIRGAMGAGKDTLAAEICRSRPAYRVRKYASALREAASIVAGIPAERMTSDQDKAAALERTYEPGDLLGLLARAVVRVTGAEPQRGLLAAMAWALTGHDCLGPGLATLSMTVGRLLQVLGTDCFRALVGEDVWVDALFRGWAAGEYPPVVVADVRFPNEAAAVRRRGGVIVLVRRGAGGRADGRAAGHASERALDDEAPDLVLDNDGTIEDLRRAFDVHWPFLAVTAATRRPPHT
jgi:hypothetical protein